MFALAPVMFLPGMLTALALLFAFSWILVRHVGLAAVVALSPLPGFLLATFGADLPPSLFECVPGFIVAAFLAGVVAPLAASAPARMAVRKFPRDLWPVFVAVLLLFVPAAFIGAAALACMAGQISAIAVTALAATSLSYDEDFVVRINRAGEARIREIAQLDFLTKSRWGMSIGGVTLVFSVLGFFGAQKGIGAIVAHPALFVALAFIFVAGAFAASRNVRRSVATVLAMAPVALLLIALLDRFTFSPVGLLLPLAVSAMPVMFMTASALGFERSGDSWETATLRGLERFGPAVVVTAIASAAASILCEWSWRAGIVESAALLLGGAAALILQPALTTMLYSLFPKRVSLEEAFRRR
jgi:hypothetical protein